MAYTTVDNPELFFQTKLYTGNGGTQSITLDGSEDMQPDWVWLKSRSNANSHELYDSVRGVEKPLYIDSDSAEATNANGLTAFGSDGFTVGLGASVNGSGRTFVSWNWKAGTSFSNDASATGIGTIDSSGSVSDTAGFSIIIRTGTASAGTIKHGLSTTPKMIITKMRNAQESWGVYNVHIGNTKYLKFDVPDAEDSSSVVWNNTTPTASVFSVGSSALVNGSSKTYVDYVFSDIKGYSKFGSYTGNGNADGTFSYTGFKPAFVIIKRTDSSDNWYVYDTKRDTENPLAVALNPDTSGTEFSTSNILDFLSNGFKLRSSEATTNASGGKYIYMAFAENSFVNSNGVPNNAE